MKLTGEKKDGADTIMDGCEMISPAMFREFVVPYYNRFYAAFPGKRRGTHNCGNVEHLLPLIRDEVKITYYNGFGFPVRPEVWAKEVGSAFSYSGGLNPVTLGSGTDAEVEAEVKKYAGILGPYEAYMVCDGYNVVPGTTPERLNGVVKVLDEIGLDFKNCR
jgi:uroporphyrinogen-III decarboxylase